MKKYIIIVIILLMGIGWSPVQAQGDFTEEDLALIEYVQQAYANLQALDSFQVQTDQEINQTISTMGLSIIQTITQSTSASIETDGEGLPGVIYTYLEQSTSSDMAGQVTEVDLVTEGYYADGEYSIRFTDLPIEMAGLLPSDWTPIADLQLQGMDLTSLEFSNWNSVALYEVSPETVEAIKELPSEEVNGVEARVFNVIWLPQQLLDISGLSSLFQGEQADLVNDVFQDANYYQRIWIDPETEMLLQIEIVINVSAEEIEFQGQTMGLIQESSALSSYFGFDEPIEFPDDLPE